MRRSPLVTAGAILFVLALGVVVRNQIKVFSARRASAAAIARDHAASQHRRALFALLQPVALANCEFERFGEPNDGGYLLCGNLLSRVQSAYSYGISGYDKWGCDISTRLNLSVHQYDCFDTTRPVCPTGRSVFHSQCVWSTAKTDEGRLFDTLQNQLVRNGDAAKRIVMKMDVEGAEWDSLLSVPDEVLQQIDQMAVEFHHVEDPKFVGVVERLKRFFEIAHIHFNNGSCVQGLEPFPTWAYEVLFVSKQLAVVDPSRASRGPHPLDAPNDPSFPDCQPAER
jgi:hypothetical protein